MNSICCLVVFATQWLTSMYDTQTPYLDCTLICDRNIGVHFADLNALLDCLFKARLILTPKECWSAFWDSLFYKLP